MKVSLSREEETSGVFKKITEYVVVAKVELTPDEKNAIKSAGIEDLILMEYSYKGTPLDVLVKSIVYRSDKGSDFRFVGSNAIERNALESTFKEALTALKSQIEAQTSGSARSETFEL